MTFVLPASPCERRCGKQERGFALLIVLWTVVLLALLVTHLTAAGRGATQLAGNLRLGAAVEAAADGATMEAIFHAIDTSDRHWAADGAPHRLSFRDASVVLRIENEAGKINPSTVQPQLFEALLHAVGVDAVMAASITHALVAWRFPTSEDDPGVNAARTAMPAATTGRQGRRWRACTSWDFCWA